MAKCKNPAVVGLVWPDGKIVDLCDGHATHATVILEALGVQPHEIAPKNPTCCQEVGKSVPMDAMPPNVVEKIKTDFASAQEALRVMLFEAVDKRIPTVAFAVARDAEHRPLFLSLFTYNEALLLEILILLERHGAAGEHRRFEKDELATAQPRRTKA